MKKSEVKLGRFYEAKVSNRLVTVRIDGIRQRWTGRINQTVYDATNTATGKSITIQSAAKIRREMSDPAAKKAVVVHTVEDSTPKPVVVPVGTDAKQAVYGFSKSAGGQHGGPVASAKEEAEAKAVLEEMERRERQANMLLCEKEEDDFRNPPPASVSPTVVGIDKSNKSLADAFRPKGIAPKAMDTAPHLVVEARAGTGKTTTLVEGLKVLKGVGSRLTPSPQQKAVWDAICLSKGKVSSVCFVAFNKSIAAELKSKVVPLGYAASTNHGMGFKAVRNAFGKYLTNGHEVNENRVSDIISEITGLEIRELRKKKGDLLTATEKLVSLCKMNLVGLDIPTGDSEGAALAVREMWDEELEFLAAHYEVELLGWRREIFDLVPQVLNRCLDVASDGCINYDDMIWLPIAADLPVYKYDLLLVDEAQDLNRCQQALVKKAGKRIILCGDPRQAIYGFAGADAESMPRMLAELKDTPRGCLHLHLTVTRRCGKKIVADAKKIVPDFEAFETNCDGSILHLMMNTGPAGLEGSKGYAQYAKDGDMILCRTNAPLVSECFKFIKAGRKATILGRDIAQGLISTVTKTKAETVIELVASLDDWLYEETRKENAKRNPSENRLIALQDRHDCLMCFVDGSKTVQDVIDKIDRVFTNGKVCPSCSYRPGPDEIRCRTCNCEFVPVPGVRLSSIHKAKGLESNTVFILEPKGATVPHPMAKSQWQIQQEFNLRYVAITRAIKELVYVTER